jgi:hypothetical protein
MCKDTRKLIKIDLVIIKYIPELALHFFLDRLNAIFLLVEFLIPCNLIIDWINPLIFLRDYFICFQLWNENFLLLYFFLNHIFLNSFFLNLFWCFWIKCLVFRFLWFWKYWVDNISLLIQILRRLILNLGIVFYELAKVFRQRFIDL